MLIYVDTAKLVNSDDKYQPNLFFMDLLVVKMDIKGRK